MKNNSKATGFIFLISLILIFNTASGQVNTFNPSQQTVLNLSSSASVPLLLKQLQSSAFEENKGQIEGVDAARVIATYKAGNVSIFLMKSGISYQFNKTIYPKGYKFPDKNEKLEDRKKRENLEGEIQTQTYRMDVTFLGANANPEIITDTKSSEYVNYYNRGVLDVHSSSKIIYRNVYPNIDWVIYKSGDGIKYDFIVRPRGNPQDIALQVSNAERLELDKDGSLILENRLGHVREHKPVSFQDDNAVASSFKVKGNIIKFEVGAYDLARQLTIDPSISWATYYGGNTTEFGQACCTDNNDNVYLAGSTKSSVGIAASGFSNTFGGGFDAFLVKFNSSGQRLWATYYGGNKIDYGNGCAADKNGNVYLSGATESPNNISTDIYQDLYGGASDAFIVKFNSNGQRQWATYFGQSDYDAGNGCAVDIYGNLYLTGRTFSIADMNVGGFQNYFGGSADAFLTKFSSSGMLLWSTYYGGGGEDYGETCSTDKFGNVYMVGSTLSTNNISTNGSGNSGTWDGFIVKFNSSGQRLWGTYFGGLDEDHVTACAPDANGNVYLTGNTLSSQYISYNGFQNVHGGSEDAFLVKLDNTANILWTTYYGGNSGDYGTSCVVDTFGDIYLAGYTSSESNISSGGFQDTVKNWYFDAFAAKFKSSGERIWGTYYGGTLSDIVTSCALDHSNNLYLAGYTQSADIEAPDAYQDSLSGDYDAMLVKIKLAPADGTGINEQKKQETTIYAYPNPASDRIYIKSPIPVDILLYSLEGKRIIYQRSAKSISVAKLPSSSYWLIIRDQQGRFIKAEKFVKL